MRHIYQVGDKITHEGFGEGLVVDVRRRAFYDILEVAFGDGVRKITSIHPQIHPDGEPGAAPAPKKAIEEAEPARRPPGSRRDARRNGAPPEAEVEPLAEDAEAAPPADPTGETFSDPSVVQLDRDSFRLLTETPAGSDPRDYALRLDAVRLGLNRGFERLISLESINGIQRYRYQVKACLSVLRTMNGRALLADEVGLGKTIEAGIVLKEYVLRGLVKRCLILVPVSLVTQWQEEMYQKFDLEFEVYGRESDWSSDFLIASLDTAKTVRNRKIIHAQDYDMVIVDEAHRLRNHQTLGWKFVDALSVKHILLLTATPVQNDLRELYNLVTLLKPGALGTYRSFRRAFMVRGDKRLPKNTRELSRLLNKVMIRTTRSSTSIKFPNRHVEAVNFELGPLERELYDGVSDFVVRMGQLPDDKLSQSWHFVLMVLQKEIGSSTFAARSTLQKLVAAGSRAEPVTAELAGLLELADSISENAKLDGVVRILEAREGEKIIIFTQFLDTLAYLERALGDRGIRCATFHGGLSAGEKEQAINRFRRNAQVLVSSEAGGEGRNLQFCRNIVNYDLPWNPMRIEQRIGRVHRLGQKRDVNIYNFTAEDTVESYVLELLIKKIRMFELVIGEMDMILGSLEERSGTIENRIFQIWSASRDRRVVRDKFDELGEELEGDRKRYETVKELDSAIFDA